MSNVLRAVYLAFAIAGLVTALWFGVPYWSSPGASIGGFVALAYSNAPGATLSVDITVVYLLANVFVVVEGRRLGMRFLWLYPLLNTVVAVAFGLPLFLLAREIHLDRRARQAT